jgi:hypothetical protein
VALLIVRHIVDMARSRVYAAGFLFEVQALEQALWGNDCNDGFDRMSDFEPNDSLAE